MAIRVTEAGAVPPQPWRNGGGATCELLAWPSAADWVLRISMADIAADGPFSAFPGIERWFVVLSGAGVSLAFAEGERVIRAGDPPLRFDGGAAPGCRLLDGPTRDLNLMLRGASGLMKQATPGVAWDAGCAQRGLFTAVAGRWSGAGEARRLGAHSLLWEDAAGAGDWRFEPDDPGIRVPGWWLGLAPGDVPVPVR